MYRPSIGRWSSRDPALPPQSMMHLYRYSSADPTNAVDPSGLRRRRHCCGDDCVYDCFKNEMRCIAQAKANARHCIRYCRPSGYIGGLIGWVVCTPVAVLCTAFGPMAQVGVCTLSSGLFAYLSLQWCLQGCADAQNMELESCEVAYHYCVGRC